MTGTALPESVELFRELSEDCLNEIEKNSEVQNFRAGHVFFTTGGEGEVLYLLEKGRVQTFRNFDEKKLIIADLKPPAVFGEMGCVGKKKYHCSAQTMEASRVRIISKAQVEELLEKYPSVTRKLLDLVSERFVNTLLELETSSFRQLIPRLARLLIEKAEGECVEDVTHKELAERLRVYRETATSALGELRKAGIISLKRKKIRILDRARLERAARE